jgi:hypothetical protein
MSELTIAAPNSDISLETFTLNPNLLIQVCLNLLAVSSEISTPFKEAFKVFAPTIAVQIETLSGNPNCTCKKDVAQFVGLKIADTAQFLFDYINTKNLQSFIAGLISVTIPQVKNIAGKVAKTTIAEWPEFAEKINNPTSYITYRNFSVVKEGNDVYVFFL